MSPHEIRSAARLVQSANEYGISRFRPSALVIQLQRESKVGTWVSLLSTSHKSIYDQLSSQQCQGSTQQEVFQVVVDYGLRQFLVMATVLRITISWTVDNV